MSRPRRGPALPDLNGILGAAAPAWVDAGVLRERASASLGSALTRESWKYTPLPPLLETLTDTPAQAAGSGAAVVHGSDQPGIEAIPLSDLSDDDEAAVRRALGKRFDGARHAVADLSLLKARGGWLLKVSAEAADPVTIVHPPRGVSPVFLVVAANASVTVIEQVAADGFLSRVLIAELGAGARLDHFRADLANQHPEYALLDVHLGANAGYRLNQSSVGGQRRRNEIHVTLHGEGGDADLRGAYLVEDGRHLDQQLVVEHRAGRTRSRQKFHGIGAGKGRSVFNGRIHIHPGAPGSDAALSNRNLPMHPDAEMNTKPELEIYTDDVRCAHGATVGALSGDALFYLRSRGVPEGEARKLLAHGFVRECLDGPLADQAARRFMEALA